MPSLRPLAALLLVACGPTHLESQDQVDNAMSRGDFDTACLGLASTRETLRQYTAEALAKYDHIPATGACLCAAIFDAEQGAWDPAVAAALAGSRRDDVATCLVPALSDARVTDKPAVATALGRMIAPSAWKALEHTVRTSADADLRAACVAGLEPAGEASGALLEFLGDAALDAPIRVAAAQAVASRGDKDTLAALRKAARDDDAGLRLAAVTALGDDTRDHKVRELMCLAMMEDPDGGVRAAAVRAFKGTTDKREAECLVARLQAREDDGAVREALLDALKASPHDVSRAGLCNHMGPYIRMYVKDKFFDEVPGADIVGAQNHNDWENSYACVEKAIKQGGYSCQARNYLAHSFNELGGKATPPRCPGM